MPRYTVRLTASPRPAWFAGWEDAHDTIPGINYREGMAALFATRAEAEGVAARLGLWVPVVEEG